MLLLLTVVSLSSSKSTTIAQLCLQQSADCLPFTIVEPQIPSDSLTSSLTLDCSTTRWLPVNRGTCYQQTVVVNRFTSSGYCVLGEEGLAQLTLRPAWAVAPGPALIAPKCNCCMGTSIRSNACSHGPVPVLGLDQIGNTSVAQSIEESGLRQLGCRS